MKNKQLIKLANLIDELNNNNYQLEAYLLNQEYIKIAQSSEDIENAERLTGGMITDKTMDLVGGKKLTEKLVEKMPSKIKVNPGSALKGFGVGWLTEMGLEYALDFFEDSKGPYHVYKSNKSDMDQILEIIIKLLPDVEIKQQAEKIKKLSNDGLERFEEGKKIIKTSFNINSKVVYNSKNQKIAVRGNAESRLPEYLRTFLTGTAGGAAAGGILGGPVGALVGGATGGAGNLLALGAEDAWYENLSNTGKAFLQSKDLKQKAAKMYDSLKLIDQNLANDLFEKSSSLMKEIEKINLNNKDKNMLENLVQSAEQKLGLATNFVKDKFMDSASNLSTNSESSVGESSYSFQPNRIL